MTRLDARYALGTLVLAAAVVAFALRHGSGTGPLAESPPHLKLGAIEVGTEPLGASVWLDGAEAGRSPLTLSKLMPGRHAVRVALAGFSPAELTLDVPAGVFAVPLRFTLQPVSPILQVHSEPEGADVFVDGQARGTTPLETLSIPTGKHKVEITRNGFAPWTQNVTAHAGDRIPLLGRLQPRTDRANTAHLQSLGFVHPGDFLEAGPDLMAPQKISGEVAPYPESARKLKLHGTVTIEMTINERGEPTDLRVVESAGETLDAAVLAAVATWRYTPPEKNGVKVQTRLQVKQTFAEGR